MKRLGLLGTLGGTLKMDMFIYFIQKTLYRLLEVHAPTKLVKTCVGVLVLLNIEATSSNALHLLRYALCAKIGWFCFGNSGGSKYLG